MEEEVNLPSSNLDGTSSPQLLHHFKAAFKRHRPLGTVQTNSLRPKRLVSRTTSSKVGSALVSLSAVEADPPNQGYCEKDSAVQTTNADMVVESQEHASITIPSVSGITFDENVKPVDKDRDCFKHVTAGTEASSMLASERMVDNKRRVQFLQSSDATSLGEDYQMVSELENLSSHLGSLALTEMEWDTSNPVNPVNSMNTEAKQRTFQKVETNVSLASSAAPSALSRRTKEVHEQLHQFKNFLSKPTTQSSVIGQPGATTTSIRSTSAPMLSTTTYCSHSHPENSLQLANEPLGSVNGNSHHATHGSLEQQAHSSSMPTSTMQSEQTPKEKKPSSATTSVHIEEHNMPDEVPSNERGSDKNAKDIDSRVSLSKNPTSDVTLEPAKPEKQEKASSGKAASAPRKKTYDPDLFFKVNGKLYQRLGKIGSGGSSEVHKVISSDCKIYALKKIKLKGRDYGTAYSFCQEIEYLNRLKGKANIIQLIDYEVTDKILLNEVVNGTMSNKDGKVKDDGYIYMVLEYGEVDLAHMLSQKWKEIEVSSQTIDDNWLRFYWQQILQAVNTIHEERIVHSDLKPANFLLVKGSLKLIDFGIAKAIMSDTTNIQRDSQVGTLSYMSPEAFLCNEKDANGNTIKCGRSSDIWSLGCILYQMVYGRTPFADYKTFWAKFKVITDPNHEIIYEPVSNPWLIDLMKKCLVWNRDERWRIPQLLEHPFLVPRIPSQPSLAHNLLWRIAEACKSDQDASMLCSELQQLISEPVSSPDSESLTSHDQQCKLLARMSKLCFLLQEHLKEVED